MSTRRERAELSAATPVTALKLHHLAKRQLRQDGYKFLEDLSELREGEFRAVPRVGRVAAARIRACLQQIGMDFKPEPASYHLVEENRRNFKARDTMPGSRPAVTADDHVSTLGLRTANYSHLVGQRITKVGDLAKMTTRELALFTGSSSAREIVERLRAHGLDLADKPDSFSLWFHGFYRGEDLEFDLTPAAPLRNLAPRITRHAVQCLQRAGAGSIGDLQRLHAATKLEGIAGLGKNKVATIVDVLRALSLIEPARGAFPDVRPDKG